MAEQDGGAQSDVGGGDALAAEPPARARARPCAELGEQFSLELAEPYAHLVGVCAKLRVSYASYKRWMAKSPESDAPEHALDPDLEDFQCIVLAALERERVKDLQGLDKDFECLIGANVAKASALVNKHQNQHGNRFKRLYAQDDEPKRTEVELGNKDGKAFRTDNRNSHSLTEATRRSLVTNILGVPESLLDAGAKLNDPEGEE